MELLDIVDENGKPTGETVERKTAHRDVYKRQSGNTGSGKDI